MPLASNNGLSKSRNTCRGRIQVMADHSFDQIDRFIEFASAARQKASEHIAWLQGLASNAAE